MIEPNEVKSTTGRAPFWPASRGAAGAGSGPEPRWADLVPLDHSTSGLGATRELAESLESTQRESARRRLRPRWPGTVPGRDYGPCHGDHLSQPFVDAAQMLRTGRLSDM